ncbi:hypothetical protein B0A55_12922 [Friedmanniomyces simplex]|uniref:Uncharacterized protein n=1 Tax=Friedmanniomyces simplex TaxID=329884 RepID=A0A4U0WH93_9PEZI|nr:hypothetical protein B0A55_12922 [Friedmanniomyces simplex]
MRNTICLKHTSVGPVTTKDLIGKLQAEVRSHSKELDRIRWQVQEQQASRKLRQEQESAYGRSLAQGREKVRKRREEEAEKESADREARRTLCASVCVCRGEIAWGYGLLKDEVDLSEKEASEQQQYEHEYGFRLVSPVPRFRPDYGNDTLSTLEKRGFYNYIIRRRPMTLCNDASLSLQLTGSEQLAIHSEDFEKYAPDERKAAERERRRGAYRHLGSNQYPDRRRPDLALG